MFSTLFLDAASPTVHVGLQVAGDDTPTWRHSNDEAGVGLFRIVDELSRARGISIGDVQRVVFCEGPGSLLGVRLVAIALRTWAALPRKHPLEIQAYRSLEFVAAGLLARGVRGPFHVIVDGRRATWNALAVDADGRWAVIRRRPAAEPFAAGERIFHPQGFPLWQTLPAGVETVEYVPAALPESITSYPLLRDVATPDAYMTEMPVYREWTPEHPVRPS